MSIRNGGYTLIELIIVTTVFSIIILGVSRFAINGLTSYQYLQAQTNTATDLNNQIGRLSTVLRGTTDVSSAAGNDLTVYAYFSPRDNAPDKVRYYVSGSGTSSQLLATVIPATGSGPTYTYDNANAKNYTVATTLTTAPSPVFTYYDDLGNALGSSFNVTQIKQIGIYLSADPNPSRLPVPITVSSRVTLRNKKTNL